jgi:hypothetical protein
VERSQVNGGVMPLQTSPIDEMPVTPEINTVASAHARSFPWRWIAAFMLLGAYSSVRLTLAVTHEPPFSGPRLAVLFAAYLGVLSLAWRVLRTTVRDWQRAFAEDLEYTARRSREAEESLRFRGP